MAESTTACNVVKLKPEPRRRIFNLKPIPSKGKKKAGRPLGDFYSKLGDLQYIPPALTIGGLSDIFFALFAHIGQKPGRSTIYRRLSKFAIEVKGPAWTMHTARTFLFMAEYFQKVWWYRSTTSEMKLSHLSRVELRDILLSCSSVFKKPLNKRYLDVQKKELNIIWQTTISLRDLETGTIYKNIANIPVLLKSEPPTLIDSDMVNRRRELSKKKASPSEPPTLIREPPTLMDSEPLEPVGRRGSLGKNTREDINCVSKPIGKPNPQSFNVNFTGSALMWIQVMTGGAGAYKLQAFDCQVPADHKKMAEYLSCAFFSSFRNIGNEKRPDRNVCFEAYAASIGMAQSLTNSNRHRIIDVLQRTAPYFCKLWGVQDNILTFCMSRSSDRKGDKYNG